MDFERRVHEVAQRRFPRFANQGYPPMVTVYMRHGPVLLEPDGRPRQPLTLDPRVLEAASRLRGWADLLVVPSNTPHLFLDAIRDAAGCEVPSLVEVTIDELRRVGVRRVGLLGLGIPQAHAERLEREGIEWLAAPADLRARLDEAILRLMEGADDDSHRSAARAAVEAVRRAGAQRTVLGCTEIPLLLGGQAEADDLINPAQLLAEAVVRLAAG
jgi:aspartate racemase